MPGKARILAVIPARNRKAVTLACLKRLARVPSRKFALSVLVVDDGSSDGTSQAVRKAFPKTVVLRGGGDLWWSGAMNLGVAYALRRRFDFVLSLNDDIEFEPAMLAELYERAAAKPGSMAAPIAYFSGTGRINQTGNRLGGCKGWIPEHALWKPGQVPKQPYQSQATAGFCLLIPAEAFREAGLYEQRRLPHYLADLEFAARAVRAGFPLWIYPDLSLRTERNRKQIDMLRDKVDARALRLLFLEKGSPFRPDFYFHFYRLAHPLGTAAAVFFTTKFYGKALARLAVNWLGIGKRISKKWPIQT